MLAHFCTPYAAIQLPSLAQGRAPIGEFLELIFVAIFLLVPVIRGIFQGKKEGDKTTGPRRGPAADEDVGEPKRDKTHSREFWETLLKGEAPPTAEELMQRRDGGAYSSTTKDPDPPGSEADPIVVPKAASPSKLPPRSSRGSGGTQTGGRRKASGRKREELRAPNRGSLVQLEGLQGNALTGLSTSPKTPAPSAPPKEVALESDMIPGLGSGVGSGLGERLESHVGGLVASDEEVRTGPSAESRGRRAFDRPNSSREWRRAMVLSEIVAPPLALRDPDDGIGTPPGLR